MSNVKQRRTFTNFEGGQSIFYIPPRPSNELESYNFVLAKKIHDVKEKAGYFSWANSRELVINSGNTFSKWLPKVDSYLREKCK